MTQPLNKPYLPGAVATVLAHSVGLTFGGLGSCSMGHETPALVIGANPLRRELILCNCDAQTTGYLAIGTGEGLTTSRYSLSIGPGESIIFSEPLSTQEIWSICGQANVTIAWQEAE